MAIEAGWYQNPENSTQNRWWDGTAWTEHILIDSPAPTEPGVEAPLAQLVDIAATTKIKWRRVPKQKLDKPAKLQKIPGAPKTDKLARPSRVKRIVPMLVLTVFLGVCGVAVYAVVNTMSAGNLAPSTTIASDAPQLPDELQPIPNLGVIDEAEEVAGAGGEPSYQTCADVEAAGKAPIYIGEPGWDPRFDSDGDGIGCDT